MRLISRFDDNSFLSKLKAERSRPPVPKRDPEAMFRRLSHAARAGAGFATGEFERFIGMNDLVPTNYLDRAVMAARTVCRIAVPGPVGNDLEWGTGFMVSPRLMITNNHVIGTAQEAARAIVEFNYELDVEGRPKRAVGFRLAPEDGFITSPKNELDFTLVAVRPVSEDGTTPVGNFGFLRLDAETGKIQPGEFVTIIQHPGSEPKKIALRENKVVKIGAELFHDQDNFLWYSSDTAPGSSGAPVCSDAWQVVAIHHASVPTKRTTSGGKVEFQLSNGKWLDKAQAEQLPDDQVKWIANEGIRVSRLVTKVGDIMRDGAAPAFPLVADWLADARGERPFPGFAPGLSVVGPPLAAPAPAQTDTLSEPESRRSRRTSPPRPKIRPPSFFSGRKGYDPAFLGPVIELPDLSPAGRAKGELAPVSGAADNVLRYMHYSVKFNAARKLAYVSAVNIDGQRWVGLERDRDEWFFDGRIDTDIQLDDALYSNEPNDIRGSNQGWFDRGHLTRRQDPLWGDLDTVQTANEDTFLWTNCSPQYWGFNRGFGARGATTGERLWNGLEEFVLQNTKSERVRASVFNGPVFLEDDEVHRGVQIPRLYYKVVATVDPDGTLLSSGYIVSQERFATDIPFERMPVGPNSSTENFQVAITKVQDLTGLVFDDALVAADVFRGQPDRPLESFRDITHRR